MNRYKIHWPLLWGLGVLSIVSLAVFPAWSDSTVKIWEKNLVIPTYAVGAPEPNPMFYFGRVSQGAEGRIYPYSLYDKLTGKKVDKTYKMVYLENEYLKIGVLPEIGGRIFEGLDKTNNYNFIYRQHVIKPALIGLIGAWISGGVEWNIPHHHRASTYLPVQYRLEENADGSKTAWVGELELRHRTRWAVGYTLRPGKSYLETSIRIVNRTPVANSILCFANVAVHVNDDYQVIFPPRTQYVTHHAKREFTTWPIATTWYGGYDFSKGVDVSWYKNHISANSMFAWNYEDDFFAGYDHGRQAGIMSVADHHIVPGKKLWTWGNGQRGRMWDKILTDDDGPYIELMVGAYSDNQPDFSWMQPFDVRSFKEYFYPFRDIGGVKSANLNAAVNLDVTKDGIAKLGFYTTAAYPKAAVLLKAGEKVLLQEQIEINPAKPFVKEVSLPAGLDQHDLRASLSVDGKELAAYSSVRLKSEEMPEPVEPPSRPEKIKSNELLYLIGLRIEQFHNPALEPDPYWEEALRRDPHDVRVNTALGISYIKRGRFEDAEKRLRKALERPMADYTTPKDAEPFYYLGVALKAQGKNAEAFDFFYKAAWSQAWKAPAYYSLAEIACLRNDMPAALDFLDRSLEANALNIRAINLKAAVLRHLGRNKEASDLVESAACKADPLDVRALAERWLALSTPEAQKTLVDTLKAYSATGLETAVEYANAGFWQDGTAVLLQMIAAAPDKVAISPLVYYYLGYFADKLGQQDQSLEYFRLAEKMPYDYVFPFQCEAIPALQQAMKANPRDARAPYYLGNLLFDWQPEKALELWEKSALLDPSLPIVHRNLAVAYSHQGKEESLTKAIAELEKAISLGQEDPIHFIELDQLYETAGTPPETRLAMLENHHRAVSERDDSLTREIGLKIIIGKYDQSVAIMKDRQFNSWEGGSRVNIADCWTDAHLLRGRELFRKKQYKEALADFRASLEIPENLRAETREGARNAEVGYWLGVAYAALGDNDQAREAWRKSSSVESPRPRRGGGRAFLSERSAQRYYQALSLNKLGQDEKAAEIFQELVKSGNDALGQTSAEPDFFAAFGERQSSRARTATAHYVIGLGLLGLGETERAKDEFILALEKNPGHLGARTALGGL